MLYLQCLVPVILLAPVSPSSLLIADVRGGLWGGRVATENSAVTISRSSIGFPRQALYYSSLSLYSGRLLMETTDHNDHFQSLRHGPICSGRGDHSPQRTTGVVVLLQGVVLTSPSQPYLSDCGPDCGWFAFVSHDAEIYFVLLAQFGQFSERLRVNVQLRRLSGCEDQLPVISHDPVMTMRRPAQFDVLRCSSLVADIFSVPLRAALSPKTGAFAYSRKEGNVTAFYVFVTTSGMFLSVTARLYRIDERANVRELVQSRRLMSPETWDQRATGSISGVTTGLLCWSWMDELRCKNPGANWTRIKSPIEGPIYSLAAEETSFGYRVYLAGASLIGLDLNRQLDILAVRNVTQDDSEEINARSILLLPGDYVECEEDTYLKK